MFLLCYSSPLFLKQTLIVILISSLTLGLLRQVLLTPEELHISLFFLLLLTSSIVTLWFEFVYYTISAFETLMRFSLWPKL